jgi:DNA-binding SARP family transcriptional activator
MIRFRTLGGLDLRDDRGVELRSLLAQPKRVALLSYLALNAADGFCRRDLLFALFWPEFDADRARNALRQALHFLRRTLGTEVVVSRGDEEIGLNRSLIWCDAVAFQNALDQGRAQDALELYRGDLLPGFYVSDGSPDFEQWLDNERTRLRQLAATAAWSLSETSERAGTAGEAARCARDAARLAPDDEAGVRRLIMLLDRLGDRGGALRTYDSFALRLRQQLDLEPARETRSLVESLRTRNDAAGAARVAVTTEPVTTVTAERRVIVTTVRKRRHLLMGVGALALTLSALVFWQLRGPDAPPVLAVSWVENEGDSTSVEIARLLPGLLATDLSRVRGLSVISDARIYEVLGQLGAREENAQTMASAARRAGAGEVIEGVLYRQQHGLRLDLRRFDLRSGVVREVYTVEGATAFELTELASKAIAGAFGLESPPAPNAQGTRSLAARRLYEQGLREHHRGGFRAAHDLFAAAFSEDTTFAMAAHYAAGSRAVFDIPGSYVWFERARRLAEGAPERDRLLIRLAQQYGDHAPSLAVAETLATRYPTEPIGHLEVGKLRYLAGDFTGALTHARRVLAMDSLSLTGAPFFCRACEAYSLLVNANADMDSLQAARHIAREWINRQPRSAQAWIHLSAVLARQADDSALVALRESQRLEPTSDLIDRLAQYLILADDFAEAERVLRAQLRIDPRNSRAIWYLMISLRNQGRINELSELVERLRATDPDDNLWRIAAAQTFFEAGQFRSAALRFDSITHTFAPANPLTTAGALARHQSWSHTHVATALAAAGDTTALQSLADSIEAVAHLSSFGRDWHLPHHVRGLLWVARGQPARAVESFRAATYSPNAGYTRTNLELARALLELGRPAQAVAALQPALRGNADASNYYVTRTELHELLAHSFQRANRPDSALVHYRKVVSAWSDGDPPFRARADSARRHGAAIRPLVR